MVEVNNKFFREDEEGYITLKSSGVLKPITVMIPFLCPSISSESISCERNDREENLRRREEIDLNLEYPDGSNIYFFPIGKTIISYYQQIQKGKWMEPELDQIDKYWGGYGLSYVYIGIPCIIYDWLQDSLSECFSYGKAQICLDEEDCEEIMERAELGRNDTHVWVEAEVKDKICGMSKDGERFQSSITHYMFLNKKSVQGRGSIQIRLRRFYENDWSSQKSDWYLLFQIDRLDSYELVDTTFDDDDCKP